MDKHKEPKRKNIFTKSILLLLLILLALIIFVCFINTNIRSPYRPSEDGVYDYVDIDDDDKPLDDELHAEGEADDDDTNLIYWNGLEFFINYFPPPLDHMLPPDKWPRAATLNGFTCESYITTTLDIPTTINGYKVFNIANSAFDNLNIETVNFRRAYHLRFIGSNAFANNSITYVNLSNLTYLQTIAPQIFLYNPISRVVLNNLPSLNDLNYNAFINLSNISSERTLYLHVNEYNWINETWNWYSNIDNVFNGFNIIRL